MIDLIRIFQSKIATVSALNIKYCKI